ncbi:MAG: SDR family NAD(P)-dependent oxidoreductase, partial [Sneathiellales bacterium]|nr:SDR family NAD(P)-dependent oxidoreductase [Sneathiellales bacterium]
MTKTVLITGSTDGIGLLTAKNLAAKGHRVILHGRNPTKLQSAVKDLGGKVAFYATDLSSLKATAALGKNILEKRDHIDVLINNAGIYKTGNPVLENGQDVRFVVNTLAPHILTSMLLPILPKDGRIISLSSAAQATVDIAALKGDARLDDMGAYAQSKRALTLWSQEMARQHPSGPVFIAV